MFKSLFLLLGGLDGLTSLFRDVGQGESSISKHLSSNSAKIGKEDAEIGVGQEKRSNGLQALVGCDSIGSDLCPGSSLLNMCDVDIQTSFGKIPDEVLNLVLTILVLQHLDELFDPELDASDQGS